MTTYNLTGVDDTGATDVTADVLAFIATCSNGTTGSPNTILFGSAKTYRCDGVLSIASRSHLIIDANGSTIQTDDLADRNRAHWRSYHSTDIRFTNGIIRGANPYAGLGDAAYSSLYEAQHAFDVVSSTDITIDNWYVSNIWGDHVYGGMDDATWTDGLLVEDNEFANNGRQVFGLVGCRNVEIRNNVVGTARRSIIDLEPNGVTYGCDGIWIHDNVFGVQRLSFIASKGYPGPVHNVTIEDNTLANHMGTQVDPPGVGLRNNWIIRNNTAASTVGTNPPNAMVFKRVNGLTVTGNVQPMQSGRGMYLARLEDCTDFDVSGNTIVNGVGQYYELNSPDPGSDPAATDDGPRFSAPTVVAASTNSTAGTTLTITLPTGSQAGDTLVAHVGHAGIAGSPFSNILDSGWLVVSECVLLSASHFFVTMQRVLTSGDITAGSFTFTFNEGSTEYRSAGILVTLRGVVGSAPEYVTNNLSDAPGNNTPITGATTAGPKSLVLFFGSQQGGNGAWTQDESLPIHAQVKCSATPGVALVCSSTTYSGAGTGRFRAFTAGSSGNRASTTVSYRGVGINKTVGNHSGTTVAAT